MPEYLLELRSEEIPAQMQADGVDRLRRRFEEGLREKGLDFTRVEGFVTPRRAALIARGLPAASRAERSERRGPRLDAAPAALAGFRRSVESAGGRIEERGLDGGARLFGILESPGRQLDELLAVVVPRAIRSVRWPKSMRWGRGRLRWVRPIRSIVSLVSTGGASRVAPFELEGIPIGDATRGHPFLSPLPIRIRSVHSYEEQLREASVILRGAERRARIEEGAAAAAAAAGLELLPDPALIDELAGLAEFPTVFSGRIEAEFRHLPGEVLRTSMRRHQKFLALRNPEDQRVAGFVAVADNDPADGGRRIGAGYGRVLRARLADAAFFWRNDSERGLDAMASGLEGILYHAGLGTVADRVRRISGLAAWMAPIVGAEEAQVRRAVALSKADLASETVGEFPELQGVAGGRLAALAGEPGEVANAIAGQYRPAGPNDQPVREPVAAAVVIADRMDVLYGFFAAGERPTGSRDPFALRRAALALLRTLLDNGCRVSIGGLAARAAEEFRGLKLPATSDAESAVRDFVLERLRIRMREQGTRHDVIAAVGGDGAEDDPVRFVRRTEALGAFLDGASEADDLLAGYRRACNILVDEGIEEAPPPVPALFRQAEEHALWVALTTADARIRRALAAEDFTSAAAATATLRMPIDAFFEAVLVNADESDLRANRLSLLVAMRRSMERVAAFGELEGP